MRFYPALALALLPVFGETLPTAKDYAAALASSSLDAQECYRVRDVTLVRDDVRIYLTDGYLIFGKPIAGRRISAVFTTETESGDGEVLLIPPHRSERRSLASYAHTPNLEEHFSVGVFLFSDGTAEELVEQIQRNSARRMPDMGLMLAEKWDPLIHNLTQSFEIRLVSEHFAMRKPEDGFLFTAYSGRTLGNFDVIYDPTAREQIHVGRVTSRGDQTYFDTWASFMGRSWRNGRRPTYESDVRLNDFHIAATLSPDLHLRVVTRVKATISSPVGRVIGFDLSSRMSITEARIDGQPVEAFSHRDSLRANLFRAAGNELFLIVSPKPLEVGKTYELEFHHEGDVISNAGKNVYFVGARGSWYPNRSADFASYDLTFRYPKMLDLVATGDIVEDREDGDYRVTRRTTKSPIRFAGFNLGDYEKAVQTRGPYTVEVYANRKAETSLTPKPAQMVVIPPPRPGMRRLSSTDIPMAPPDPHARVHELASEIASALEFMSQRFGPPPLKVLTVSPIPGTFGQGFPGLLYISTLSYLNPKERPSGTRDSFSEMFFSEVLQAHETAHQWWGNLVTTSSYQDDWLMEALANYSALLYIEKKKGRKAVDQLLESYKAHLLEKVPGGDSTLESVGPIAWGTRLYSSQAPDAWRIITYEKGSWIFHMLRGRMGDDAFLRMLAEMANRYRFKPITTEEFHKLAAEFMPPYSPDGKLDAFFEQWVYGTGIPTLHLNHSVTGKSPNAKVRGAVTQSNVDEDFSTLVPVEATLANKRTVVKWVLTADDPVPFLMDVKQTPVKIQLDPMNWVLATRK